MKQNLGRLGENLSQKFIIQKGYKIIATNYYSKYGEIDIIATKNNFLIFFEIKTRSSNIETALSSISFNKQKKIIKTAAIFLSKHPLLADMFTQFDVICVIKNKISNSFEIHHLEDAFRTY